MPQNRGIVSREEQRALRRDRIVQAAREMAEASGWDGVTTRRLAEAIEFSQPVLYGHFPQGKSQIMAAVAQAGFVEIAAAMRSGAEGSDDDPLSATVRGYLDFATRHPATYDAMFSLSTDLLFADPESPEQLRTAFDVLVRAVGGEPSSPPARTPSPAEISAELLWGMLHGLALLERGGRMRAQDRAARIDGVLAIFRP